MGRNHSKARREGDVLGVGGQGQNRNKRRQKLLTYSSECSHPEPCSRSKAGSGSRLSCKLYPKKASLGVIVKVERGSEGSALRQDISRFTKMIDISPACLMGPLKHISCSKTALENVTVLVEVIQSIWFDTEAFRAENNNNNSTVLQKKIIGV